MRQPFKIGDPVEVRHVHYGGEEVWLFATVQRDEGWKVTVVFADSSRKDVEPKHVRKWRHDN